MNNTSILNLSQKIDPSTVEVLQAVSNACTEHEIPWIVVGATARDLLLHHGYGAKLIRATQDIDFAIEVADWESYNRVKQQLVEQGFKEARTQHRLYAPNDETIDLVPFGQIENEDSIIEWPSTGEVAMNVLGFSEACDNAEVVLICDQSNLVVPVATPVGMMLLKLIAWTDRSPDIRGKDATDIKFLIENYELIPRVVDEAYAEENTEIMEKFEWDLTLAAAYLLGQHANQIASDGTSKAINALVNGEFETRLLESLIGEMSQHRIEDERNFQMIEAFTAGFQNKWVKGEGRI